MQELKVIRHIVQISQFRFQNQQWNKIVLNVKQLLYKLKRISSTAKSYSTQLVISCNFVFI